MSNIHKLNISKLDVGMIAALEVLLSERSVSRAAQSVGLTQPAMSNALARMRRVFDDPLLVRGRTGMMLTARAEDILAQLSEVVPQLETLGRPPGYVRGHRAIGAIAIVQQDFRVSLIEGTIRCRAPIIPSTVKGIPG